MKESSQSAHNAERNDYLQSLFRTFWSYRRTAFAPGDDAFETHRTEEFGPPVFRRAHAGRNVLLPHGAPPDIVEAILDTIPVVARHKWFGSMRSSQALAQSVFGGLRETAHIGALEGLMADDGRSAFFDSADGVSITLEHTLSHLNEPRPTSVDVFIDGTQRVAVEVKLAEGEFGCCSRPTLTPADETYARDHCDGSYTRQRERMNRCSLSAQEIRYWEYLPRLFDWPTDVDQRPCPLASTYQLARNLIAATTESSADSTRGHVLVIYDERNPAFWAGGRADSQWHAAARDLRNPELLRKLSWQRLAGHLMDRQSLRWLTTGLRDKYGIVPTATSA
jgi:hypothetical protein